MEKEKVTTIEMESVLVIRDSQGDILCIEVNDMKKRAVVSYTVNKLGLEDRKEFYGKLITGIPTLKEAL